MTRSILALVIVAIMLAVGLSEGGSDSREVVQASEILAKIERDEPVEFDNVIIEGDLNLVMPTERVDRTWYEVQILSLPEEAMIIKSPIRITNSEVRGIVNFSNTIFWRGFRKT